MGVSPIPIEENRVNLNNKRIAVLAENDFEDLELWYPLIRLREAYAETIVVGLGETQYTGKHGLVVPADASAEDIDPQTLDGIVVPGGWSPDKLRRNASLLKLVRDVAENGKMIASICHGPWVLISARIVSGRTLTGVIAVKDDIEFAGGQYVDEEVVVDDNFVTSRTPRDIPAWGRAIVAYLGSN